MLDSTELNDYVTKQEQFKPDSRSWSLESVKFLGYYGSYEKARNIAAESDYTSITEILGRGCRISKPTDAERQYNKRFASPVVNGFITDEDEEEEKNKKIDNCTKLVCRIGENGADFMKNVFTLIYDDKFAAENTWMGKKNKLNLSELKFNKTVREVIQSKFPDLTSSDFTRKAGEWFRLGAQRYKRRSNKLTPAPETEMNSIQLIISKKCSLGKLIDAYDKNVEFKISLLDAILMLDTAWRKVSQKTIANCFRHAGFYVDTGFDEEDNLPLAQWMLQQHNDEENEKPNDLSEWANENHIQDFESFNLNEYIIDNLLEITEFPDDDIIVNSKQRKRRRRCRKRRRRQ
ncbi:hypothetical protein RN001_001698 [Aquatica leii]|uniref:Uncharacterized protein n=1 Tax=Aquatica leii TaxID=1421715 RepID=A0AAN7Q810_9COLE|nr:hypothetical protein RN001_001698 [Aquatica leii]